jgi:hypothetical protein
MKKVDLKQQISSYKAKRGEFSIVDVPSLQYLMIDGDSGPDSDAYMSAIQTLYPVAYKLKFSSKQDLDKDYVVPPLESLWWAEDFSVFTTNYDKSQWLWTAMILTPEWITKTMFREALAGVSAKTNPEVLKKLRLEKLSEGRCVQTLHVGSFEDEGPVLKIMHEQFIPENGLTMRGRHHEIYFSDFRRTPAEKLRTILRQPVA